MSESQIIKILLAVLLAASIFVVVQKNISAKDISGKQDTKNGIIFQPVSFQEALKLAKKQNKPVFLDAYASWCVPCKLMSKKTFSNAKVGTYFNQHFINLKMDMEKGEGPAIAKKLQVTAYPTCYFIAPNGKVIQKVVGYRSAKDLLQIAKSIKL